MGQINARNSYIAAFTPLSEGYFRLLERAAPAGGSGRVGRVVLLDVTSRRLAEFGIERFLAETEGGGRMRPQRVPAADHVMAATPAGLGTLAFVKCAESVLFAYRTVELISRPGGVGVRVDCGLTLIDARTGGLVSSHQFRGGDPPRSAPHLSDKHYGERPDKDVIEFLERAMAR